MARKQILKEQPYFSQPAEQAKDPDAPWSDRVAAYQRVKPKLEQFATRKFWTREKFIAHWTAMIDNPKSSAFQVHFAKEALANLRSEGDERQPGED